ncbi:peptidase M23 [Kitasatospora sp. NPDC049285]|uniref:CIS tube protein n=1 Tax=Kitasatospora sp. NPDC049285 TaxID=3157096 RepID=UPI0034256DFA
MIGGQIQRARLTGADGTAVRCQFNPTTVRRSKTSTWTERPTRGSANHPVPQFVGTGPERLTVKLLFDGFDQGPDRPGERVGPASVQESVDRLLAWTCVPEDRRHAENPQPPAVTFAWAAGLRFTGFVMQVDAEYTMFGATGLPLRATAEVTLQAIPDDPQGTNPTSGGIAGRRAVVAVQGDTLASVAYREYGDPQLWRAVAIANGIEDPARVPPGTRLLLPPRAHAVRLAGAGEEVG